MARSRSTWSQAQWDDYVQWHEKRMKELGYPEKLADELRRSRGRWKPKITEDQKL